MIPALLALVGLSAVLALLLVWRPAITIGRTGKVLAFLALCVLPLVATGFGTRAHLERSKITAFCLSCHVMEPYGETLALHGSDFLPASHFQNHRVPPDKACFSCHTQYTMFGDFKAKLNGMRHVWVNYVGTIPEQIELYEPYKNRECLHCHGGARSYVESELHADMAAELAGDEVSCLECHDQIHPVDEVDKLPRWPGAQLPVSR